MFHEFGHALHGIFADEQYPTLSGTNTARDFVEFPSQFNEHWATDPKVFAHYAKHYQTGAPMPQALVDKMKKAGKFNSGYDMTELVSAALARHELAHARRRRAAAGCRPVRGRRAEEGRHRPRLRAAALPLQLLPAHLGQRLRRRLLRLPVDADAGRRRLHRLQGTRRPDPRERRPLPRDGAVARQHRGAGEDVQGLARPGSAASSRCWKTAV